jgi:cytochrome b subunit of formate dehydrogenase
MGPRLLVLALPGLALAAAPSPAAAQDTGGLECAECHDDVALTSPVHGDLGCTDCHSDISDFPHPDSLLGAPELCAQCHDAGPALAGSAHAFLSCEDCHGAAHQVRAASDPGAPTSHLGQIQTCGGCHGSPEILASYLGSVHGRAVIKSGLAAAPTCSTCHGSHGIFPPTDEHSSVSHQAVPETCGSCHVYILRDWRKSSHGRVWTDEEAGGPVCTTCHASHRIEEPRETAARLKFPESCGGCHRGPYESYRDTFHGKATHLGFVTAAICSDCHTAHLNLPAADAQSSVAPANLPATCGSCHGEVSAAFVSFDPHSDPTDPARSRPVHLVWLVMTGLLVAVFGLFGLHDLLWLQRSLVALSRGEVARGDAAGPWVRRFSPIHLAVHGVVIATFLVLAATGLPLRFHFTEWAQRLAEFLGGIGTSRVLHRLMAALTFAYFLFHLGHLAYRGMVKKESGLLWGWRSMVPRGKDFADLGRNLRYFFYLGRRPAFDRFTYWEKFDYFAVFWGVVIIGASGLILWFPRFFTRFLPGWALNAAALIHGDEALLAVGFIFVFHFFHTHLRPGAFPLDPVIFVGAMPLERFKEERPLEFQRLVDRGELDRHLVSPPSRARLRMAYIVGFTAVAIGVLLVVGILWAVLAP